MKLDYKEKKSEILYFAELDHSLAWMRNRKEIWYSVGENILIQAIEENKVYNPNGDNRFLGWKKGPRQYIVRIYSISDVVVFDDGIVDAKKCIGSSIFLNKDEANSFFKKVLVKYQ